MALAYDYTYQEWLKSHPKPVKSMALVSTAIPKKFSFKQPVKAPPAKAKAAEPKGWTPQNTMGFRDRGAYRRWLNAQPTTKENLALKKRYK